MSLLSENELQQIGYRDYLHQLSQSCALEVNKNYLNTLVPGHEFISHETNQLNRQMIQLKNEGFSLHLRTHSDFLPILDFLKKGGSLSIEQAFHCLVFFENTDILRTSLLEFKPKLGSLHSFLPDLPGELFTQFRVSIGSESVVLDSASDKLNAIRRRIVKVKSDVHVEMKNCLTDHQELMQEYFYDEKSGRFVVPVKTQFKRSIEGKIVNYSNTGQTAYLEPKIIQDLNEELNKAIQEEHQEILRILHSLSRLILRFEEKAVANYEKLKQMDFLSGTLQIVKELDYCLDINFHEEYEEINSLINPLLVLSQKTNPVANSVHYRKNSINIISGPNAGGKSVFLKGLLLAQALFQSKLLPPVKEASTFTLYDHFYFFSGDYENITSGASSFSGQVSQILPLIKAENLTNCLFVADEILSATNSLEGSALSQAILEKLQELGVSAFVSTHFQELLRSSSDFNHFAMEFVQSLPTFKLLPGKLGHSHAIDTAARLGVDSDVISRSKELINRETARLQEWEKNLRELEQNLKLKENTVFHHEQKTLENIQNRENKSKEIISLMEAKQLQKVLEFEKELNQVRLQIMKEQSPEMVKYGQNFVHQHKADISKHITEEKASKDINLNALRDHFEGKSSKGLRFATPTTTIEHSKTCQVSLDLRGKKYLDAQSLIEENLHAAVLNRIRSFQIIHGHGQGALKGLVREGLKSHPLIAHIIPEQNDGVTTIEVKLP